jgi:hypothetical protein
MSLEWILLGLRLAATIILYTFLGLAFYLIWRELKQAQAQTVLPPPQKETSMAKISATEFKQRLEAICLSHGGGGLPRKRRDQDILFKSIMLFIDSTKAYSENELNQVLEKWLSEVGQTVAIDHVSLRRHLVDAGYLRRDLAGAVYKVHPGAISALFEPAVDELDPARVIEKARQLRAEKKRQYQRKEEHL